MISHQPQLVSRISEPSTVSPKNRRFFFDFLVEESPSNDLRKMIFDIFGHKIKNTLSLEKITTKKGEGV